LRDAIDYDPDATGSARAGGETLLDFAARAGPALDRVAAAHVVTTLRREPRRRDDGPLVVT